MADDDDDGSSKKKKRKKVFDPVAAGVAMNSKFATELSNAMKLGHNHVTEAQKLHAEVAGWGEEKQASHKMLLNMLDSRVKVVSHWLSPSASTSTSATGAASSVASVPSHTTILGCEKLEALQDLEKKLEKTLNLTSEAEVKATSEELVECMSSVSALMMSVKTATGLLRAAMTRQAAAEKRESKMKEKLETDKKRKAEKAKEERHGFWFSSQIVFDSWLRSEKYTVHMIH